MGTTSSQAGGSASGRVLRYGAEASTALPAELSDKASIRFGASGVLGVAFSHASSRALPSGQIITARPRSLDVYNATTGDRRLRLPASAVITAFDARDDTLVGDVMAVGTSAGDVVLFRTGDVGELCSLHTNGVEVEEDDGVAGGGEAGGAAGDISDDDMDDDDDGDGTALDDEDLPYQPGVTCVSLVGRNTVFVGHGDGAVRAFRLDSGELFKEYRIPTEEEMAAARAATGAGVEDVKVEEGDAKVEDGDVAGVATGDAAADADSPDAGLAVAAVAVLTTGPVLVAVGLASGVVHFFDMKTTRWETKCTAPSPLTQLVAMNKMGCVLTAHTGHNVVGMWDMEEESLAVLDFRAEAERVQRPKNATITAVAWDADRARLMTAYSDGAVLIRSLSKGATGAVAVRLCRVCKPSTGTKLGATIVSLWYDAKRDDLFTGGFSGITRVITNATGIPFDQTQTAAALARSGREADGGAAGAGGAGAGAGAGHSDAAPHVAQGGDALPAAATEAADAAAAAAGASDDSDAGASSASFAWAGGSFKVALLGGGLHSVLLNVGPISVSPLADGQRDAVQVPFGRLGDASTLTPEWQRSAADAASAGDSMDYAAKATWTVVSNNDAGVVVRCEFPASHPVASVTRTFAPSEGGDASSGIQVTTQITTRAALAMPIGLRVPLTVAAGDGASTAMQAPAFEFGMVHPNASDSTDDGEVQLSPGASFVSLAKVPRRVPAGPGSVGAGTADVPVDVTSLPLTGSLQTQLQLSNVEEGRFGLRTSTGVVVSLAWDSDILASLLLQVSTAGASPAVVACPMNGAFDLGNAVSNAANPLSSRGVTTATEVQQQDTLTASYTLMATAE